jgi:molybdopterin converting factor small subunit
MTVTVQLHATLKKHLPADTGGRTAIQVPAGATVADLIDCLRIPPGHAKMMVSGDEHLELTSELHDGQEVNLFPPLAGGVDLSRTMRRRE